MRRRRHLRQRADAHTRSDLHDDSYPDAHSLDIGQPHADSNTDTDAPWYGDADALPHSFWRNADALANTDSAADQHRHTVPNADAVSHTDGDSDAHENADTVADADTFPHTDSCGAVALGDAPHAECQRQYDHRPGGRTGGLLGRHL